MRLYKQTRRLEDVLDAYMQLRNLYRSPFAVKVSYLRRARYATLHVAITTEFWASYLKKDRPHFHLSGESPPLCCIESQIYR